ncbi:hypothetical protein L5515_011637 [Caenorhabditis briggsae]|uniref:Uncharacterized protein n=1 Tax=Caenorhabditis briggsae TaxID=6238 RepID=A0AAE9EQE8_CAEBR|nr:hypothetical protein L5515_011637 [Caenorhabditis briggsae]
MRASLGSKRIQKESVLRCNVQVPGFSRSVTSKDRDSRAELKNARKQLFVALQVSKIGNKNELSDVLEQQVNMLKEHS